MFAWIVETTAQNCWHKNKYSSWVLKIRLGENWIKIRRKKKRRKIVLLRWNTRRDELDLSTVAILTLWNFIVVASPNNVEEEKQGDLSSQTQFLYPSMPFFLLLPARFFFFFFLPWKIKWRSTKREEDITVVAPITFGLSNFYWAPSILFFSFFLITSNIEHVWSWISIENKFQIRRHICIEFNEFKNFLLPLIVTVNLRISSRIPCVILFNSIQIKFIIFYIFVTGFFFVNFFPSMEIFFSSGVIYFIISLCAINSIALVVPLTSEFFYHHQFLSHVLQCSFSYP